MNFYQYCADAEIKVRLDGKPVHAFFKPDGFLEFGTGTMREPVLRDQIVDMDIDEFLGLAEPIPKDDLKRHAKQEDFKKDVLSGKKTDWEIPYLTIAKNEDEVWKVVGHDGRHRAMLLQSLGYKTMPVHIRIPDSSLLQSETPRILWCQNDKHIKREKDYYPFPPITGKNYNKPYCEVEGLKELNIANANGKAEDSAAGKEWHVPESCAKAKSNYEAAEKSDAREAVYRADFKLPFSTYQEFVSRQKG